MPTDAEIIEGCLKNSRYYQEIFYNRFASKMFGVCMRYAGNKDLANDLFQEGFIKVFQNLHRFKGEKGLNSWVYKVFVSTSVNYITRTMSRKFEVSFGDEFIENVSDDSSETVHDWLDHISQKETLEMVQALPEKYRVIINLYAIEKMSHHEISKMLDITESTSRSQLSRARKILTEQLNEKLKKKVEKG